ncbi:MAG: sulfatase family protein [Verrucomicrobiaceae bacterium]
MKLPIILFSLSLGLLSAKKPNIVFIFSDDHAPHAIGAYEGWLKSVNPTPNIDKLAKQGMLFKNSFCTNSICGPSRAVILTGKHSHKNGFMNNGNKFDGDQQTFPKILQKNGYRTAIFGKWHLKSEPQGFDAWKVLPGQGDYYNPDVLTPDGRERLEGHCTDVVTDLAVDWLKQQVKDDQPFMLMCQHKAPHRNWMPALRHLDLYDDIDIPEPATLFDKWEDNASPARWQELEIDGHMHLNYDLFYDLTLKTPLKGKEGADRSAAKNLHRMTPTQLSVWNSHWDPKNDAVRELKPTGKDLVRWKYQRYAKNYLRCVKGVDESVGAIMENLEDLGIADNTIVIYSSDQGFYIGDHGWFDKRWMYEESLKMPFIVKWPGVAKPGTVNEDMVQNLDYAPTFLEATGSPIPADLQGKSLVPLLRGESPEWRDSIYYHYYEYPSVHMIPMHNGIRTERYKLIHFYNFDEWELYDLEKDPDELKNIYNYSGNADLISGLKSRLNGLIEKYEDNSITPKYSDEKIKNFRTKQFRVPDKL